MCTEIAATHPEFIRKLRAVEEATALDLWQPASEGPKELLDSTVVTQPVLLACSAIVYDLWHAHTGETPALVAGHSLGEYTALVIAGVVHLHDAVALVRERAQLMQDAVPRGQGAMLAVLGAEDAQIKALCARATEQTQAPVAPANFNTEGQVVVAGATAAVATFKELAAAAGIKRMLALPVSVPAHTPLMASAAEALADKIGALAMHPPKIPILHNVHAEMSTDVDAIRESLVRQLYHPVLWRHSMRRALDSGVDAFVECGPGTVLAGLMKRIDRQVPVRSAERELLA